MNLRTNSRSSTYINPTFKVKAISLKENKTSKRKKAIQDRKHNDAQLCKEYLYI